MQQIASSCQGRVHHQIRSRAAESKKKKLGQFPTAAEISQFSCRGSTPVPESEFGSFSARFRAVLGCFRRSVFWSAAAGNLCRAAAGTDPSPQPDFKIGRFVAQNRLFSPVSVSVSDTTRHLPSFHSKLCRAITFAYELRFRRTSTQIKATEKFFPATPTPSVYAHFLGSKLPKEFGKAEIFGL